MLYKRVGWSLIIFTMKKQGCSGRLCACTNMSSIVTLADKKHESTPYP